MTCCVWPADAAERCGVTPEPRHVHVYSVFGRFCYRCFHRKRWYAFWESWIEEDHDEPF